MTDIEAPGYFRARNNETEAVSPQQTVKILRLYICGNAPKAAVYPPPVPAAAV